MLAFYPAFHSLAGEFLAHVTCWAMCGSKPQLQNGVGPTPGWVSIRCSRVPQTSLPGTRIPDAAPSEHHLPIASTQALPTPSLATDFFCGPPILNLLVIPALDQWLIQHSQRELPRSEGFKYSEHGGSSSSSPCAPPQSVPPSLSSAAPSAPWSRDNPSERAPGLLQAPFPAEGQHKQKGPSFGGTSWELRTAAIPRRSVLDAASAGAGARPLPSAASPELSELDEVLPASISNNKQYQLARCCRLGY